VGGLQPLIVASREKHAIVNGLLLDNFKGSDVDGDGMDDLTALIINELAYFCHSGDSSDGDDDDGGILDLDGGWDFDGSLDLDGGDFDITDVDDGWLDGWWDLDGDMDMDIGDDDPADDESSDDDADDDDGAPDDGWLDGWWDVDGGFDIDGGWGPF
jgi:hypothetical protein